jgi:hypothetical protein
MQLPSREEQGRSEERITVQTFLREPFGIHSARQWERGSRRDRAGPSTILSVWSVWAGSLAGERKRQLSGSILRELSKMFFWDMPN